MTPRKPPRNRRGPRPYLQHGLTALESALARVEDGQDWTVGLGSVGVALRAWRADLIDALGGDDTVSPQRRALVELATRTHLMVESVDRYILGMPSLVNKSKRAIFAVVKERQALADALARYLAALGLDRAPKPAPSLDDFMSGKVDAEGNPTGPRASRPRRRLTEK
jgi:hypothetical protein